MMDQYITSRGNAMKPLQWTVAGLFLALTIGAVATPQKFGTRQLEIPDPQGFVPLSGASPRFMEMAAAYLPPTNRLLEVYATPADRDVFAAGSGKDLLRYFQLQTLRKVEGEPISSADFAEASAEMESGLKQTFANIDTQASDLLSKGNASVKEKAGVDPQIAASDFGYLGVYRREPWAMFFSISTKVAAGADSHKLICAGALTLINHQLIYLYAYANFDQPADRSWAESAVSSWADAVHAANPDDAAMEATASPLGFNWRGVGRAGLIGGIIGGLVGLVMTLVRKKKQ
jgi:hypothetical protein